MTFPLFQGRQSARSTGTKPNPATDRCFLRRRAGLIIIAFFLLAMVNFCRPLPLFAQLSEITKPADRATDRTDNDPVQPQFELIGIIERSELNKVACPKGSFLVLLQLPNIETTTPRIETAGNATKKNNRNDYIVFRLNNLSSPEELLLQDASDGVWNKLSPIDATLIAESGMTLESLKRYREKIDRLEQQLAHRTKDITDPEKLTRAVFEFLHQSILTGGYDLNRSNLSVVLDTGVFNCVSATILFNYFASCQGLEVTGLETTGHAKSRVLYENEYLDIETTCTNWNLLPDRRYPLSQRYVTARPTGTDSDKTSSGGMIGQSSPVADEQHSESLVPESVIGIVSTDAPEKNSTASPQPILRKKRMRQINFVQLAATVYYNQGVDRSQNGDFPGALVAYVKAIHLDPNNPTIMGNLKATLNNWAIELATTQQNFPESIRITDCGLLLDPDFEQFRTNLPIFYQHWISELKKESRQAEADYLTREFNKRFP